jgi:hypothetical protein
MTSRSFQPSPKHFFSILCAAEVARKRPMFPPWSLKLRATGDRAQIIQHCCAALGCEHSFFDAMNKALIGKHIGKRWTRGRGRSAIESLRAVHSQQTKSRIVEKYFI